MATYQDSGAPVTIGSTVTAPPPEMLRTSDALATLQQAWKDGIVNTQDLLDLQVKPYQRKAAMASYQDSTDQSLANMKVRPSASRAAISQNTFGADTSDANDSLVPATTGLQAKTIAGHLADTGVMDIERDLKASQLKAQLALLPIQTDIAKATTEQERALAQGRLTSTQNILQAETDKFQKLADDAHRMANDPGALKAYYEGILAPAGRLTEQPGTLGLPELAAKVKDLYNEQFQRAYQLAVMDKQGPPGSFNEKSTAELSKHPAITGYNEAISARRTMQSLVEDDEKDPANAANGTSDNALVENYVKVLNPSASIKMSNVELIHEALPLLQRIQPGFVITKGETGAYLNPQMRKQMLAVVDQQIAGKEPEVKGLVTTAHREAKQRYVQAGYPEEDASRLATRAVPDQLAPVLYKALREPTTSMTKPANTPASGGPASAVMRTIRPKGQPAFQALAYPDPNDPSQLVIVGPKTPVQ